MVRGLISTAAVALAAPALAQAPDTTNLRDPVVITDVRVFTGDEVIERATVVLADGVVARIALPGEDPPRPLGARTYDGMGKTLIPGLIDAHTHTFSRVFLKNATQYGVAAHLDMFTAVPLMVGMHREQATGRSADRPDLFSAGTLVTAAGGHGTQYGLPIPTLDDVADADRFVADRLAEGSDYIKIIIEDGSAYGGELPSLDEERVRGAVEAAHTRGALAVAHISSQANARMAIERGVDGLVHTFASEPPDPDFGPFVARSGVFLVPTLVVLESVSGESAVEELIEDPVLGPTIQASEVANLRIAFPEVSTERNTMEYALASVRAVLQAGGTVLAGSDAPNPGTVLGLSLHREMELLVRAGMSPVEALRAATAATADAFGLEGRGRIVEGGRADVLLIDGDPTTDIRDSRYMEQIWKEGRRWMLELARAESRRTREGG